MVEFQPLSMSRSDLLGDGFSPRQITRAVAQGDLIRARNGTYLNADADADLRAAARAGGRLTCVSALSRWGLFVLSTPRQVHVQMPPHAVQRHRVDAELRRHWGAPLRDGHPQALCAEPLDALFHAMTCQEPRGAVASLDAALRLRVIVEDDLDDLLGRLPRRFRVLRRLCNGRSESGPESLVRLMLDRLGCRYELQVRIRGVGRVDLLVDGWLIIECDGQAHHGD